MFSAKYATLCLLLITYHWHASWAVSGWPSGGRLAVGIAAEVNGSPPRPPTDAPVHIPVVKRSSNQGCLANEPPARCPPPAVPASLLHRDEEKLHSELLELLRSRLDRRRRRRRRLETTRDRHANDLDPTTTIERIFKGTQKMTGGTTTTTTMTSSEPAMAARASIRKGREFRSNGVATRNVGIGTTTTCAPRIFDIRRNGDKDRSVSSREKREVGRIDSIKAQTGNKGDEAERSMDYDRTLGNVSSDVSSSEFTENVSARRNKATSGITSFLDVTKLLDHSRLHQQSRNTKPRTIVQHLRRNDVAGRRMTPRRAYRDSSRLSRRMSGPPRSSRASSQLRFIPYYDYYRNKNFKPDGGDVSINEIVALADNAQLSSPQNITDLAGFEQQIADLSKSLGAVLNRQLPAGQRKDFPNVRAILPKRVFIAPPRIIYDTKILPAPFGLNNYFENSGSFDKDIPDVPQNIDVPSSVPMDQAFVREKINNNLEKRPLIPVREDTNESLARAEILEMRDGPRSDGISSDRVSASRPANGVRKPEMMENPSRREEEMPERPKTRARYENSSKAGKVLSPENVRSGYDVPAITSERDASGNVDHSGNAIVVPSDDEYANQRATAREQRPSHRQPAGGRTSQPSGARDKNYDRNGNKWRGNDENDRTRYLAKYSFGYLVNDEDSRNDFGHHEMRDEGITKGRYHVKLPDGRIQKVNYQVDDNGYRAVVSYQRDQRR